MFVDFEDRDFEIIGKKLIEIREHPRKYIELELDDETTGCW